MFGEFLDAYPLEGLIRSMPVCPFPSVDERTAWDAVRPEDREDLLNFCARYRNVEYPLCRATQFMAFSQTGSRAAYEKPYFLRRRKLIAALLDCCLSGGDDALGDVIDGLWCICEESSWVVSAHNVNPIPGAPTPQEKRLPDVGRPYIDIFAAQTAMIVSLTCALLGNRLDGASPVLRERAALELEARVLRPFMERDDFWWMGVLRSDLCNWTPWIVSNILLTASLQLKDRLRFCALADRACRVLDRWLLGVPQDGGCDEGTAYWNMAGGALLDCLCLLERATEGKMTFWHEQKIRGILSFPAMTRLQNGWFVNFADCDARPFVCGERVQTAGEKLGDEALRATGSALRGRPSEEIDDVPHLTRLLHALFHPPAETGGEGEAPRNLWLGSLQLRVLERDGMTLCAKGGHNGESHNHNDVGSFMLYVDAEPAVIDMGNVTYTAKTFSPERYTLMNTRSAYHNVPLLGGREQQPGREHAAQGARQLPKGMELEMSGAYERGVARRFLRRMELDGGGLVLRDEMELVQAESVTWVFMLRKRPEAARGGGICFGGVRLSWSGPLQYKAEEIRVNDARMAKSYPGSIWRLQLTDAPALEHEQTFTFEREDRHE